MSVRIDTFPAASLHGITTSRRAVLACGCSIFIAADGSQIVTRACCAPHEAIVGHAADLLAESGEPLNDCAVAGALAEARREIRR